MDNHKVDEIIAVSNAVQWKNIRVSNAIDGSIQRKNHFWSNMFYFVWFKCGGVNRTMNKQYNKNSKTNVRNARIYRNTEIIQHIRVINAGYK